MNLVWLILYHLELPQEQATDTTVAYAYKERGDASAKFLEVTKDTPTHTPDGDTQYYTLMSIEVR